MVPVGAPVALSATALLKPPDTVVVIVDGPEVPWTRVTDDGDAAMVKSGTGAVQPVARLGADAVDIGVATQPDGIERTPNST